MRIFSASRHLESSSDAPSAVTIITAEEIHAYGWRTLGDVLNSVRGFYTAYDRNYTYLGTEGVLRPGDYNSRMLLMINGHRLNENVYDSAPIGTEFPLDLDLVDRIEIVRGPASSLFGTNAVFGVINVITRKAAGETIELAGDTSSGLERSGRLTSSFQKGRLAGLLSGNLYRANGQSRLFFPEFDTRATNYGVAENGDGDGSMHAFGDLEVGHLRLQGLYSERTKSVPTAPLGSDFNKPATSTDQREYVDLAYHRPVSATTDLDLRGYFDGYSYLGCALYTRHAGDTKRGFLIGNADWSGSEAVLSKQIGKHRVMVGGQYEYTFAVRQKTYIQDSTPTVDERDSQYSTAIYGQAELKLARKLAMNAGLRWDWFDRYGGAASPRMALVFSPDSKTAIKYIIGRAFRAPNAFENWYADGIYTERPLNQLRVEETLSEEAVLERIIRGWSKLTTELFYNDLSRLIDSEHDSSSGLWTFANSGRYKARGLGVEWQVNTQAGVMLRSSYTLADATDSGGLRLAASPVHSIKLDFAVPMPLRTRAAMEVLYTSSQVAVGPEVLPSALLTNFTFSTKSAWHGWDLSASCYNALNRKWFAVAGPTLPLESIEQDGRSFRVSVARRFSLRKESRHE